MRMAVLSFIGMVFFTSAAAFPTTPLPSSNWPQHCAYGEFDKYDVVGPTVENAVKKAKDSFEIQLTGTAGGYEYGPFTVSASQLQPMKRRLCMCSDGDKDSFCALYNTSMSLSVPWKIAIPASGTTKAVNGTFRVNYHNAVVMVRFRLVNGEDEQLCVTSVYVPFSEITDLYAEGGAFPYEPLLSSSDDPEEYGQLARKAYDSVHAWLDGQIHVLDERICFNLA
ncbi:uncharacterized protein [Dermacentor albipictus]|uniref:uncharacterized protein n=1 Tax=Dermacentor albipictus TaxID=60249 RepID=UPI0031FC8220